MFEEQSRFILDSPMFPDYRDDVLDYSEGGKEVTRPDTPSDCAHFPNLEVPSQDIHTETIEGIDPPGVEEQADEKPIMVVVAPPRGERVTSAFGESLFLILLILASFFLLKTLFPEYHPAPFLPYQS